MKKAMKTIGAWLAKVEEQRKQRSAARRQHLLDEEAQRRIQVREFKGELFVCFDDMPLVWSGDLRLKMSEILRNARATYVGYHNTRNAKPWDRK